MGLTGLKPRCRQGCALFWRLWGGGGGVSVSLLFPAWWGGGPALLGSQTLPSSKPTITALQPLRLLLCL